LSSTWSSAFGASPAAVTEDVSLLRRDSRDDAWAPFPLLLLIALLALASKKWYAFSVTTACAGRGRGEAGRLAEGYGTRQGGHDMPGRVSHYNQHMSTAGARNLILDCRLVSRSFIRQFKVYATHGVPFLSFARRPGQEGPEMAKH
jgi:hypothetical protein